jgi:hypothetical protein
MFYRQRDDTLVLTDVSVAAARSNINRNDLITKIRALAAREAKKRKENVDRAKAKGQVHPFGVVTLSLSN